MTFWAAAVCRASPRPPVHPRADFQGISDDAELQRIMSALPNFTTADATDEHEGELHEYAT
jgi:hypothetical protein